MSSYVKYCRDQAAECARRAKLASSPEIVARCRRLGLRWVKLAQKAQASGRSAYPRPAKRGEGSPSEARAG
jgi:hypothetical protein